MVKAKSMFAAMLFAFLLVVGLAVPSLSFAEEPQGTSTTPSSNAVVDNITDETGLKNAINTAEAGDTITLANNIELTSVLTIDKGITLDLGGNILSGATSFTGTSNSDKNLVNVVASDTTITNGSIVAGANNRNVVNVWGCTGVTLSNLEIDHSASSAGAPLIVGSGAATLSGDVEFITGAGSWYAVNVDSNTSNNSTTAALTVASDANLTFSGTSTNGICLEGGTAAADSVAVTFNQGATITAPEGANVLYVNENSTGLSPTVNGAENVGLPSTPDSNGNYTHTHTYGTPIWAWAADYTTATATFVCQNCVATPAYSTIVDATITSEVTTQPTATTTGVRTYTATVTDPNGVQYQDTATAEIPIVSTPEEPVDNSGNQNNDAAQNPSDNPNSEPSTLPKTGDTAPMFMGLFASLIAFAGVSILIARRFAK